MFFFMYGLSILKFYQKPEKLKMIFIIRECGKLKGLKGSCNPLITYKKGSKKAYFVDQKRWAHQSLAPKQRYIHK